MEKKIIYIVLKLVPWLRNVLIVAKCHIKNAGVLIFK